MKRLNSLLLAAIMVISSLALPLSAFAIDKIDISGGAINLASESYVYTGSEITPEFTVTVNDGVQDVTLDADTDYTVTYSENRVDAGNVTITVEGTGDYTGQLQKSFTIAPCSLTNKRIKYKNTVRAYPGIAPEYAVYDGSELLTEGVDYTVNAEGYDKAGVNAATVTIQGKGNYSGTKVYNPHVYPKKVMGITTKSRTVNSLELTWDSQEDMGATGYRVYTCDKDGNNINYYASVSTNSCVVKNRAAGAYYYFIVRAIATKDSTTILGDKSDVYLTCAKPATVTILYVTKSKDKKKLTVKWDKVGSTGYQIEYSTDKTFKKGVKTVNISGGSRIGAAINIPANDKVYYARIRAYRKYAGVPTVYGNRSTVISSSFSKLYSTYTTNYVNNAKRTTNLKLACKAINGKIVYPGQTFSFNGTVGRRTAEKGYQEAYVFTGPESHTLGIGGGVCQVASTMFNAALLANFKIVERHQHSQRVTYCPLGRDAAIFWGSEDFKFKNNTNYPIKIKMSCANGQLKCSYYVCYNVSPKKVTLSVSRNGKNFTLRRTVGGKVNYTAYSNY